MHLAAAIMLIIAVSYFMVSMSVKQFNPGNWIIDYWFYMISAFIILIYSYIWYLIYIKTNK